MTLLIPVIEFNPAVYARSPRQLPEVSIDDNPQAWNTYWRESLGDAGIDELIPFDAGNWLVPISQLTRPSTLRTMLEMTLENIDINAEEELPLLPGGFILENKGARIEPTCCSDLSNLDDWQSAADWRSTDWQMVWIGHPWTHVSAQGDTLYFLEPSDDDPPQAFNVVLSVERSDLNAAIRMARSEVDALRARLLPIIEQYKSDIGASTIARILIWGHHAND